MGETISRDTGLGEEGGTCNKIKLETLFVLIELIRAFKDKARTCREIA